MTTEHITFDFKVHEEPCLFVFAPCCKITIPLGLDDENAKLQIDEINKFINGEETCLNVSEDGNTTIDKFKNVIKITRVISVSVNRTQGEASLNVALQKYIEY